MAGGDLDAFRACLDGVAISTYILAMMVVPAKIWCRVKTSSMSKVGWEEAFSAITLVWVNAVFWILMLQGRKFLGKHVGPEVSPAELIQFLRYLYAAALIYLCAIVFIKFTILAFYWKIFSLTARIPIAVFGISLSIWFVILMGLGAFGCSPIQAAWDLTITDAKCVDRTAIYLGTALPNVVSDFAIVFMPLPYVWRLNAPIGQRLVFIGLFALGFFVCIVSILRLTSTLSIKLTTEDPTYQLRYFILWSVVELNVGLVCACLPSMRPIIRLLGFNRLFASWGSSKTSGPRDPQNSTTSTFGSSDRQRSQGRRAGTGPFSSFRSRTSHRLSRPEASEDELQMIGDVFTKHGESTAKVQVINGGDDTYNDSREASENRNNAISIQRHWSVLIE